MTKKRTSLSMGGRAIDVAKSRANELGYDSVSEYIESLILQDDEEKRTHVTIREGGVIRYETRSAHNDNNIDSESNEQ